MTEKFLHFIWQFRLFSAHKLRTTAGESVEVIDVGKLNNDAGPDFFNAKLKIGDTLWAGNVEIHCKSSDWAKHHHNTDRAYDSVILHVAAEIDAPTFRTTGEAIPQMQLVFSSEVEKNYQYLLENKLWIPCADRISLVDKIYIHSWLNACLTERLNYKAEQIFVLLEENKNNWEEAFYIILMRNFGFGTNADAFERLAKSLPLSCLGKHKDNLLQLEAMLFGQAGFLSKTQEMPDDYQQTLQREYHFLQQKFNLTPLPRELWKFLRLRPQNFPTVRMAQFAALTHRSTKLFSKIIETPTLEALQKLFRCEPSEYWETHYRFGDESSQKIKQLGDAAIQTILINTVLPFLFCYGQKKQQADLQERVFTLFEQLLPEKNSIIENWQRLGLTTVSAFDTQALLQLKSRYCDDRKCLRCAIGHKVLTISN
ncbi:MAG: DUF2851 family protein [Prevotellaceae bacterium]|jgi:hypothetical protein|nr:DUF2851 family protein [Prevotellaceae bacterium]